MAESGKTEKEKSLNGELYFAFESQLANERSKCRELIDKFNTTGSDEMGLAQRRQIMTGLFSSCFFKEIPDYPYIETPFRCDYVSYYLIIMIDCLF